MLSLQSDGYVHVLRQIVYQLLSPIDAATSEGLKEATREVLENLTEREAKVLKMRFGKM
jgi:DNA-directed RNA polymerase sigma subunit (sigma70/sigma32)